MQHPLLRTAVLAILLLVIGHVTVLAQGPKRPQTDEELIAKLNELTRGKGDYIKNGIGHDFCRRLGVRPVGNCVAYRVQFSENGEPAAVFYSLNDGKSGVTRNFITSRLNPDFADDYRVDAEGRPDRAVRRRGQASSHLSLKDAGPGFKRVMAFLRTKQDELAGWPDATLSDDGACPTGEIKRTARDPSLAACVKVEQPKTR